MSEFKKGDKVIVTGVTLYGSFEGCAGVLLRPTEFHDWLVDVTFPDGSHDELGFDVHELAPSAPAPTGAEGDRDTMLRNDLFGRVQEVLDLAAAYAPGELGEFPERVAQTVADFKNYRNLAEKQIQERDVQLQAAQALAATNAGLLANAQHELEQVRGELAAAREAALVWKYAAKQHRKLGQQMADRVENAEQVWHDDTVNGYEATLRTLPSGGGE